LEIVLSTIVLAAIAQNLALSGLIGLCPMLALSRRYDVASGMAVISVVVLPLLSILAYALSEYVLRPAGMEALSLIAWTLLITLMVGVAQALAAGYAPRLHQEFGAYLPFFGMNCLVLGAVLSTAMPARSFAEAIGLAIGIALGYAVALLIVAAMRERLAMTALPRAMRGAPAVILSLAILSLALQGLRGVGTP
jgi:electron transport complex protein RnfA